jgi:hypothetical protein
VQPGTDAPLRGRKQWHRRRRGRVRSSSLADGRRLRVRGPPRSRRRRRA